MAVGAAAWHDSGNVHSGEKELMVSGEHGTPPGDTGAQQGTGHDSGNADLALTGTQNWAARSHRELYDSVHVGNDPGRVGELAHEWTRLGQEISATAQWMSERVRATEAGWQGDAATAARAAFQRLADWSRSTGEAATTLGGQLAQQGRIMETARAAMPEPAQTDPHTDLAHTFTTGGLAGFAAGAADVKAAQDRATAAHATAVAVMTRMDTESRSVDASTPRFVPPPNPVHAVTTQPTSVTAPTSAVHGFAPTHSAAAVDRSVGTAPAGAVHSPRPSGGGAAPQVGAQPQGAGAPNPEPGVLPASRSSRPADANSRPADANATTHKIARGQQPSQHTAEARTREIGPAQRRGGPRAGDESARERGPRRHQNPVPGASRTPSPGHPHVGTTSQSADGAHVGSAGMPRHAAGDGGARHPGSPQPPSGAGAGRNPNLGSPPLSPTPPTPRATGAVRRSAPGRPGSFPSAPGNVGAPGRSGTGPTPGNGGAGVPGPPETGGPAVRSGASSSAGRGAASGENGGIAPGSGASAGWAANADPNRDPHSDHGSATSADAGTSQPSGFGGMGMGMGGMGSGGHRGQDQERSSRFREGETIVDVPGTDLPPSVIGLGKKKAKKQEEQ